MHPKLFHIFDSYVVMILVSVLAAFIIYLLYAKKNKDCSSIKIDFILCGIVAIIVGIIFAILFENLYELINSPKTYKWTWGMTFYGGLFGGVIAFILMYRFYFRKRHEPYMQKTLIIAPACVCIAHAFGRIGCFLVGCCYGKETSAWFGLKFVTTETKVIPTQLFEAIFLFLLGATLLFLAFKYNFKYSFAIYIGCYCVFRFIIEFFRGDPRGGFFLNLSPSQWWCLVLAIVLPFLINISKKTIFKESKDETA